MALVASLVQRAAIRTLLVHPVVFHVHRVHSVNKTLALHVRNVQQASLPLRMDHSHVIHVNLGQCSMRQPAGQHSCAAYHSRDLPTLFLQFFPTRNRQGWMYLLLRRNIFFEAWCFGVYQLCSRKVHEQYQLNVMYRLWPWNYQHHSAKCRMHGVLLWRIPIQQRAYVARQHASLSTICAYADCLVLIFAPFTWTSSLFRHFSDFFPLSLPSLTVLFNDQAPSVLHVRLVNSVTIQDVRRMTLPQ